MVTNGKFNVDHITTQPVFDVRFSQVENVHAMQFTPEIKQFWSLIQSLFHANAFDSWVDIKANELRESLASEVASINSVCPSHVHSGFGGEKKTNRKS